MKTERWQQIEKLFHAALEHDASERAAFLTRECAGDESLRREIESLLASHKQDGRSLDAADIAADLFEESHVDQIVGRTLGPYKIVKPLGRGGMGAVFLAEDAKLARRIALKVLPAEFTRDRDRLRRFEQEARAASALNHPNIVTIYDSGDSGDLHFIAMEFVDGVTLRERLARSRFKLGEALDIASQVASALAAAHAAGIVHRDIKPENILLRRDGYIKVLDFGLAKLMVQPATTDDAHTQTQFETAAGIIVGTPRYMSPEQVRGAAPDTRTDIFSFGAVFYEMLSGLHAFQAATTVETMNAILNEEPPDLPSEIPPALQRIVRRCLEKLPEKRFQSAEDLAFTLRALATDSEPGMKLAPSLAGGAETAPIARPRAREAWIVATLALLVAGGALVALLFRTPERNELRSVKLALPPPEGTSFQQFALAPDGRRLAFVASDSAGKQQLWVRALDSLQPEPLPSTDGARSPFWSPDSRSIGFFAGAKLKRIDIAGGSPQTLCDALAGLGGSWGSQNTILFSPSTKDPIFRVPASGGVPTRVTEIDLSHQENSHRGPSFLPDGRHFLYFIRTTPAEIGGTYVGSVDSKMKIRLTGSDVQAVSAHASGPDGKDYLFFVDRNTLFARQLDIARRDLKGEAIRVARGVGTFSVSNRRVLVYSEAGRGFGTRLVWLDRSGKEVGSIGPRSEYVNVGLSPDGRRVAVDRIDPERGDTDIWVVDLSSGVASRVTSHPATDLAPVWSSDGLRIAFTSARSGPAMIYSRLANGGGSDELLVRSKGNAWSFDWSRDGRYFLYFETDPKTGRDLWVLPIAGDQKPIAIVQTAADEKNGQFSPDGRWIAYESNETGRQEVYVRPFTTTGSPDSGRRITTDGGLAPRWRRDGQELFYLSRGKLMVVAVKTTPTFQAGSPQMLFEPAIATRGFLPYDVSSDGRRFLITGGVEKASPNLTVLLDWFTGEVK